MSFIASDLVIPAGERVRRSAVSRALLPAERRGRSLQQSRSRTEFKFRSALHMKSTGSLADSDLSPSQQNWICSHGGISTTLTLCELCQPSLYDQTRAWHFL
ncbi:hypothetical protein AV530_005355 [Patagioenas fasciata monilis]|uniref:Uncharacterized protein n=1 Tax=Patagioenas fasciata monilis TaxID=372326 RepID=A0A1V4JL17_PATFA|nr:hypothetical protein AV530_005355 [Patagioenas fasciata monilis]